MRYSAVSIPVVGVDVQRKRSMLIGKKKNKEGCVMSEPEHVSRILPRVFNKWQDDPVHPSKPYTIKMKSVTVYGFSEDDAYDRFREMLDKNDLDERYFTIEEVDSE